MNPVVTRCGPNSAYMKSFLQMGHIMQTMWSPACIPGTSFFTKRVTPYDLKGKMNHSLNIPDSIQWAVTLYSSQLVKAEEAIRA